MHSIDTQRQYMPHEQGYFTAQRYGFSAIRDVEHALDERNSWAGRYIGRWDYKLEEVVVDDDCSGQFDECHAYAQDLAKAAAHGNALSIIIAQGRSDEAAQLILNAALLEPG